jgi:23S rRNA pseudouridine2605 synthase
MPLERLQKIIAAAGIASRRKAEELIQSGLVSVNGTTITELGSKADPEVDSIRVNNQLLKGAERHEYVVLNKPRGYVTTVSDPEGRPTVMELVRSKARLYPIGRLDFNSEGLLLLTNDGDIAHKLMKAASHIPKTYLVKVAGQPAEDQLRRLRSGVTIAEERDPKRRVRTAPAQIRVIKEADNPWLEVTLHEGRNRQIRKMFEEVGHHVEKIRRVRYGPLELDLPPGESRVLTPKEVSQLQHATEPRELPRFERPDKRPRREANGAPRRPFKERTERPARADRSESAPRFAERDSRSDREQRGREFRKPRPNYDPARRTAGRRDRPASFTSQPDDRRRERPKQFSDRPRPDKRAGEFSDRPRRSRDTFGDRPAFKNRRGDRQSFKRPDRAGSPREGFGQRSKSPRSRPSAGGKRWSKSPGRAGNQRRSNNGPRRGRS